MPGASDLPLLALDTSGDVTSCCVVRGDGVALGGTASGRAGDVLHGLIERVLGEAGVPVAQLRVVAAARGPGSFTGLRIGLAAAQGLVLAAGCRGAGVETTSAIARASGRTGRVAVVLAGGPGRVFASRFDVDGAGVRRVDGPLDLATAEASGHVAGCDALVLRGGAGVAPLLRDGSVPFDEPLAPALASLVREGAGGALEALYARSPAIGAT